MELFNTLTRSIQTLAPLDAPEVRMYTCGLTVYSQPHIGNWTGYIYWDVLVRALRARGYSVLRTQNITDVGHLVSDDDAGNDKMEIGARRESMTAWDIADKYIDIADHEAYTLLGLIRPDHIVRATDCISEQIEFVKALEQKGLTYQIAQEGIYFDTSKLPEYGTLARLDIKGLQGGARVSIEGKKHATDFALWKFSPAGTNRDMEWDSPWGKGFPGWHLECSVIARQTLGDEIDIHTGGIDHIPVHHTNEIAQTESITGRRFSRMWLHNNHLKVDGGKMSKSDGTVYTLQDLIDKKYSLSSFKLLILSKHYRTEGNFTWTSMDAAQNRWQNWKDIAVLRHQPAALSADTPHAASHSDEEPTAVIVDALRKDLDTPSAIVAAEQLLQAYEKGTEIFTPEQLISVIRAIDSLFGLNLEAETPDISDDQKKIIQDRQDARTAKDWSRSDALRDQLIAEGIGIKDAAAGPIWHRLS